MRRWCRFALRELNWAESLEGRRLLSAGVQTSAPPRVWDTYISGSAWTQPFRNYVAATSTSSSPTLGLALGSGALLPWVNVDRVSLRFSEDVIVDVDDLTVRGVNVPEMKAASVEYRFDVVEHGVATWTFARPLSADRVIVEVQSGADAVRGRDSGAPLDGEPDGVAGGDFRRRFDVLPGSANHGWVVSPLDTGAVRPAVGTSTIHLGPDVGAGPGRYQVNYDVNGDGRVNIVDLVEVRSRWGTRLPLTQPTLASIPSATASVRTRPLARGLFSTESILA